MTYAAHLLAPAPLSLNAFVIPLPQTREDPWATGDPGTFWFERPISLLLTTSQVSVTSQIKLLWTCYIQLGTRLNEQG